MLKTVINPERFRLKNRNVPHSRREDVSAE